MFKRRSVVTAAALAATFTLAACADDTPKTAVAGIPMGDYVMVGMGNGTVPLRNITMRVNETSISGVGPCNGYGAKNAAELPAMQLTNFTSTNVACKDLELENRVFQALQQATEMDFYGGVLRVKGPTWLIFERGLPASMAGGNVVDQARANQ